jgi:uncharacterized membrane protein YhaH (DUF805 family)
MDANAVIDNFRRIVTTQYFQFEGRTPRKDFWYYVLAYVALYIAAYFLDSILGFGRSVYGGPSFRPITGLLSLALLLPNLGISVRRLHDVDKTGWLVLLPAAPMAVLMLLTFSAMALAGPIVGGAWTILSLAPFLALLSFGGLAVLIYFCAQPGTPGANKFGPGLTESPPMSKST